MATILVVDDDADIRLLTKLTLERDGHVVHTAEDGPAALAYVESRRPDVIVLDVMMPEVDGFTVLTRLKASEPSVAGIPVVIVSALSGPLDRATGGIEGAVRYLTKPIDLDQLRDAVTWALQGPEEPLRRQAQRDALELLARAERGAGGTIAPPAGPSTSRLRLSALERERSALPPRTPPMANAAAARLSSLTDKQRGLLGELAGSATVIEAADRLGVSRSNVYASLRRISRKLGTRSVPELLTLVRSGALTDPASPTPAGPTPLAR